MGQQVKKYRIAKGLLIILGLLIIIRLILPYVILHYANKKLANLDGYYGHIDDIDLALYRGAYVINDIYIDKTDSLKKDTTRFFDCKKMDLSVQWKALFEKKIVGEVEFYQPVLKYTLNKTVGKKAEKDTTDFIELVKDFMPMRINRFAVTDGQIHYIDNTSSPKLDIPIEHIVIEGKGLTNETNAQTILPASIDMAGNLYDGDIKLSIKLNPLSKDPTFDLNGNLSKTNLIHFNPFFKAYANFDLKKGDMSMYTEFASKDNAFKGYVKPLIRDLDIVQFNKEEGSALQITWEAFIGSAAEIFQNQQKETLATKIPVEGKFNKPKPGVFQAIIAVLKNAFIEALKPAIDNTINIQNVKKTDEKKGFLKKLFGKKEKDK
jgi:hypothetical protein